MVGALLPYVNDTMSDLKLTDAEDIEVESFYDGQSKQTREGKLEVDRWTNYGHDRLYINAGISKCDKYSLYVDLQTHEIVSDNDGKHKGGDVEIDGDTAEITIIESGLDDKEHVITVSLEGEGFEAADEDDNNDDEREPEVATDGGEDMTDHVDDETIKTAIKTEIGPLDDDLTTTTVADIRDALAWVQRGVTEHWADWCSNVENNESQVVYEDSDVIVFATGEHNVPRRDLRDHYDGELGERVPDVVSAIHHSVARDLTDYDWSYEYPLVVRKPESFDAGQQYVEAVVNGLQQRGLSPGQAWAYYGVELRGNTMNSWGVRKGDHDHKNVSDALEKAKQKLPEA